MNHKIVESAKTNSAKLVYNTIFSYTLLLTITVYIHQVPRVGGIKKGWVKQFVVVCDFKLFLYDIREERNNVTASIVVNQVLDMRSVSRLSFPALHHQNTNVRFPPE